MAVLDMIQVPKIHCPDVLTLGLIQVRGAYMRESHSVTKMLEGRT